MDVTTTTADANGNSTENVTKSKNNRFAIRHWYKEVIQVRRNVTPVSVSLEKILLDSPKGNEEGASADGSNNNNQEGGEAQKISSKDFGDSQMNVLKNFFLYSSASVETWNHVGYICADRHTTTAPDDFDSYGLPIDHKLYPVVLQCEGHWYLPCSWDDKCKEHHNLL